MKKVLRKSTNLFQMENIVRKHTCLEFISMVYNFIIILIQAFIEITNCNKCPICLYSNAM